MEYFFWQNSKAAGDAMLYGAWPNDLGVSMLTGQLIGRQLPMIDMHRDQRSQGRLTDNVLMSGQGRVFSRQLVTLLSMEGVDNMEKFPCRIHNDLTGEVHEDFMAVNIIGRIACVDKSKSSCDYIDDAQSKILIWDYLTLDESAIRDAEVFVLAEMPVQIVVSRRIKEAIEAQNLTGVEFVPQGDQSFSPSESDLDFKMP